MPHGLKTEKTHWLNRLSRYSNPGRVVNVCFIVVLFFSTILTWREIIVLEDAYISSQRNSLESVAHELDGQLQFNVDRLRFYRNGMQSALETPLSLDVLRNAEEDFQLQRAQREWSISLENQRTLPVKGVSDAFVDQTTILSRENPRLNNELTAALELGYLLRLSTNAKRFFRSMMYVSRAGFYLSNTLPLDGQDTVERYYSLVTSPWFFAHAPQSNTTRSVLWQTWSQEGPSGVSKTIVVSIPLDYQRYWYGVLALEFSMEQIRLYLMNATDTEIDGEYQLYDHQMSLIATSVRGDFNETELTPQEQAQVAEAMVSSSEARGGVRLLTRYVSWVRLRNFDGVLVRIHHIQEGVRGDFGSISIALGLVWLLFTGMLILTWVVIRRMVRNMIALQTSLQWQAWYDGLTRLYNRSTLFERASDAARRCEQKQQPFAVIQMDLDHFKSINDRFGHQAGDRVLAHVAGLISAKIGEHGIAGRVGGEEFCIVIPESTLEMACELAERIRERIHSREILIGKGSTLRISASFGVSASEEKGHYDVEYLQSVADKRLYLAKQRGRNQVCCEKCV